MIIKNNTFVYGISNSSGDVKISTSTVAEQALPTAAASAIEMRKGEQLTISHTSVDAADTTTTTILTITY